jgi:hypothetical protein
MTEDQLTTLKYTGAWAKAKLIAAQKAFNKEPNGANWTACLRAMFIHQQMSWAIRSTVVNRSKLAFDLINNEPHLWGDIISRATLGLDLTQAMAETA